ncbi:hypothetical protein VroAM7_50950 (plasmid) [Vibrio rotiferianus]|uniref:HTH luxR-type domain-containing protein n=1 Tax=Vibrio rotiferianus TaxID=190895 RepID=A0A510IFE6_9VIBR|nr:LuxR C-terminal-related transcriptional regulator [Vibrio rotiferianus]BBL92442.1 hypothetical protein VroAM7_50950 [Vibrio rotiferianus]
MNDCRMLNVTATNMSTLELEQLLRYELANLGLEHFVLMIIDANQRIAYQQICGFSDQQMQVYQENMAHDAFFQHYARNGHLGQFLYMQEMLPMHKIRNPIFNEILVPTMQLYHSYSGLAPLYDNHYLMLSSHGDNPLSFKHQDKTKLIWRFLRTWGNYWVAQQAMSEQLGKFDSAPNIHLLTSNLTDTELTVLNMLAQGLDGSEVAQKRNVSKETVRSQIKQILHKTGCKHQNQLLARYFQSGVQSRTQAMALSSRLIRLI